MPRQFERYRFRDGVTPLDEATFNRVLADLDLRLASLEDLQIEWESALTLISDQGLARVAAAMSGPLATLSAEVASLSAAVAAAQQEGMLLDGPGTVDDVNLGDRTLSDASAPAGDTGTLTGLLGGIANRLKAITGKAGWRDTPATTLEALFGAFSASTSHIANKTNPHQVTAAQVGAAAVGGSGAQVYNVADALSDTHAVNRRTGDVRYVRVVGSAAEIDNGNSGSAKTVTLAAGRYQALTLTADNAVVTVDTAGAPVGQYCLRLRNTQTWIDRVYWSSNLDGRWLGSGLSYIAPRTVVGSDTWIRLWWTGSVLIGASDRVGG